MKQIMFLKSDGPTTALRDTLLARFTSAPPAGCLAAAVNVVQSGAEPAPWDIVIELWLDRRNPAAPFALFGVIPPGTRVATCLVEELVEKDAGPARGWPTPGIKMIVPWIGRADVPPHEQRRHWDEHVPLANRIHVGVTRYVRNWIEQSTASAPLPTPAWQGIAMQLFASEADLRDRLFDRPENVQVILDDVADFIASHDALVVTEYHVTARN